MIAIGLAEIGPAGAKRIETEIGLETATAVNVTVSVVILMIVVTVTATVVVIVIRSEIVVVRKTVKENVGEIARAIASDPVVTGPRQPATVITLPVPEHNVPNAVVTRILSANATTPALRLPRLSSRKIPILWSAKHVTASASYANNSDVSRPSLATVVTVDRNVWWPAAALITSTKTSSRSSGNRK